MRRCRGRSHCTGRNPVDTRFPLRKSRVLQSDRCAGTRRMRHSVQPESPAPMGRSPHPRRASAKTAMATAGFRFSCLQASRRRLSQTWPARGSVAVGVTAFHAVRPAAAPDAIVGTANRESRPALHLWTAARHSHPATGDPCVACHHACIGRSLHAPDGGHALLAPPERTSPARRCHARMEPRHHRR